MKPLPLTAVMAIETGPSVTSSILECDPRESVLPMKQHRQEPEACIYQRVTVRKQQEQDCPTKEDKLAAKGVPSTGCALTNKAPSHGGWAQQAEPEAIARTINTPTQMINQGQSLPLGSS